MSELNDLIKAGELERAAEIMYKDAFYLFNTYCPDVQITLEEFAKVAPYIIKEFQNPQIPTDAPIDSPFRTLTIKFKGPDDEDFIPPKDVVKKYYMGQNYSYSCPIIKGYVADQPVVKGKMGDEDNVVTVTYEKEEEPTTKVTLTITYVGPTGDTEFVAPAKYVNELGVGEEYMVPSPAVEGYTPDKESISGAAVDEDINETVTYAKNAPASVTLTVDYVGPEGDEDFPNIKSHVEDLEVGDVYSVDSPVVEGYSPDQEVVEGIVEGNDPIDVTVVYTKNE